MKKLSIIIPVFNEEKTVASVLERVAELPLYGYEKEIIVVNDGSVDGTKNILESLQPSFNFILLHHPTNRGKGAAIRTAIQQVTGDFVLVQDADLEYDPGDYEVLLSALDEKNLVVYGSRNIESRKKSYWHYMAGAWILTSLINVLFKAKLTDSYTCYKLFHSSLIRSLSLNACGFEIEAEITAKILKKGVNIREIPVNYNPRKFKEGKKIRFRDGVTGVTTIISCWIKE